MNALSRETDRRLTEEEATQLQRWHAEAYLRQLEQVRPLPGARDLLTYLTRLGTKWAIATSGRMQTAGPNLNILGVGSDVPIITCDQVPRAKPDPDQFWAAAELLKVPITSSIVVGDSVWDLLAARRAGALGVVPLSGGYGKEGTAKKANEQAQLVTVFIPRV